MDLMPALDTQAILTFKRFGGPFYINLYYITLYKPEAISVCNDLTDLYHIANSIYQRLQSTQPNNFYA